MAIDKQNNPERLESQKLHRRAVRLEILLPFVGGLLLIILLVVIAAVAGKTPTSGVANTMLTVLLLCPMALCLLPIYLLLVMAVFGMNRVYDLLAKPLRQLQELSLQLRDRTYSLSDRAARTSINLNARFAPLDRLIFSVFDRPKPNEDDPE
ncbi:MAG: hypothetical protein GC204_16040 [Chloroflexi bacterium]|nr:hypothetical protein [Chloroflexota bacterium]